MLLFTTGAFGRKGRCTRLAETATNVSPCSRTAKLKATLHTAFLPS